LSLTLCTHNNKLNRRSDLTTAFPLTLLLFCCSNFHAFSQISISPGNTVYNQYFNTLGTVDAVWLNNVTLPGWYAAKETGGYVDEYRSSSIATTNGIYSYGNGSERALGSLTTSDSDDIVYGALFSNETGQTINSITLSFKVEHWHRGAATRPRHQRVKVSYAAANSVDISEDNLFDNDNFIDIPEAYLISIDTTTLVDVGLNGNDISALITVTFPVTLQNNWQFFLRFYDDNTPTFDMGLAVDDLSITFSTTIVPRIVANSGYTIFSYLDMGIIYDIPEQTFGYLTPVADDLIAWQQILQNFYIGNLNATDASAYGYSVAEYTDVEGESFNILRKQNTSQYFWGTYVKAVAPTNTKLSLQLPHPVDDDFTGTQGSAVFHLSNASSVMIAGISRCGSGINSPSGCVGETDSCLPDEPFRSSDVAHAVNSVFHVATTVLATLNPSLVFVQLHGFSQGNNDSDFYISCGTRDAHHKNVPDYAVMVRENLLDINYDFDIKIAHLDEDSEYAARDNVQGRYLNLYPGTVCSGIIQPVTVTNRFLHIEQYPEFREFPNHYSELATALGEAINPDPYLKAINISSPAFVYDQAFNDLNTNYPTHTWGNNLHVPGWYAVRGVDGLFSRYTIGNGSSHVGGLYVLGNPGSSERALGSLSTDDSMGDIAYGVLFKNETGVTLYGIELSYHGEQWRDTNEDAQTIALGYLINASMESHPLNIMSNSFTPVPAGNLTTSGDSDITNELDGNTNPVIITNLSIPIELPDDHEIFIRFFDPNDAGYDKIMAVDNFSASFSSVLPVDWVYFNITKKNGKPLLQWGADKENECKRYEIFRSEDGKYFESIATIPCKRKVLTNKYEHTDHSSLWQRIVYYRIAQYDESGEVTYSQVRSFSPTSAISPNVYYQNGELIIDADKESKLQSVKVLDHIGRVVCYETPSNEPGSHYTLNCPMPSNQLVIIQMIFESGTYVTHMRTGN
jgi:hypothetical protein